MRNVTITKIAAIGIGSWIGGMLTERHLMPEGSQANLAKLKHCLSSLSSPGTVYASKAFPPPQQPEGQQSGVVPITGTVGVDKTGSSSSVWSQKNPKEQRMNQIMRFGFPSFENVRSFNDFVLSYDKRNRVPHWVFEHLTKQNVGHNPEVDRSKCEFYEDGSLHPFFRATNQDYKGSGYDRGHLAAAGNHKSAQQHCEETFILSNMSPQVGKGFNRDAWNTLEKHVRKLTKTYNNVYVCTGPLYLPRRDGNGKNYVSYEVIGPNHVAVPTHFFKVVVAEAGNGQLDMEAYVMPNAPIADNIPVSRFQVPVETIERSAGFLLFDKVQRNVFRQINGRAPKNM